MQRERIHLDDPEREQEAVPAPPVQPPERLAWASAVGNQAVQALARSVAPAPVEDEEAAPPEDETAVAAAPEDEPAEAVPEELPEDELPE